MWHLHKFLGWQTDSLIFWCVQKLGNLMVVYKCTCTCTYLIFSSISGRVLHAVSNVMLELTYFNMSYSGFYIVNALLFCDFIYKKRNTFLTFIYLQIKMNAQTINRFETPSLHQGNKQPSWPIAVHGHIPKATRIILIIDQFIFFPSVTPKREL